MDQAFKNDFLKKWQNYFGKAELPFVVFYSDDEAYAKDTRAVKGTGHVCMIGQLGPVRKGQTVAFTRETIGCFGGVRYSGYPAELREDFKFFLSYGIPGKVEGERYKKSPELVEEYVKGMSVPGAEGKYLVFKRWDKVGDGEEPQVVVFFSPPDVISGLFTLANFPTLDPLSVITPFSSGCGSIIAYPLAEREKEKPRAVLGMFDVSARPYMQKDHFSFAVPMKKFRAMVADMDESFLITDSWKKVARRIEKGS